MEIGIWVKRHVGDRYFHIDDVEQVVDHYGEAQIFVDNEGRREQGWIGPSELMKILAYKPELVSLCIVGEVRRLRQGAGLPWNYPSRFDHQPLPEVFYLAA